MKLVIWMVFALVAAVWTGGAVVTAELVQWAAEALASGEAARVGAEIVRLPLPQWAALWVDPTVIQAMQATALWAVETLRDGLPLVGSAMGWLLPLVWVAWGLGLVVMLVLAGGAHLVLGRVVAGRRGH